MVIAEVPFDNADSSLSAHHVRLFAMATEYIQLRVTNYGATLQSLKIPDKFGLYEDIVLGFTELPSYLASPYYFGSTIGRVANRIENGIFSLNDKMYNLVLNNNNQHLHGGKFGFDKVIWQFKIKKNGILFTYISPTGEEGYPGTLHCSVSYKFSAKNELVIRYTATTTEATPINLTNHSYFNLAGHGSGKIYNHVISLNADHYTPVNDSLIPTGEIASVDGTQFDLREPQKMKDLFESIPGGFDHNFCINGDSGEKKVASVHDPISGRAMEVYSTQPGVQFYTANFLPEHDEVRGKEGKFYQKHSAFCLETQNYPNAINQENFPKAFLEVGEVYNHTTRFVFSVK